jgi:hypothetical protein
MSEVAGRRSLSEEEVAAKITADIEAYGRGGADREAENVALGRDVLGEEAIKALWAKARAKSKPFVEQKVIKPDDWSAERARREKEFAALAAKQKSDQSAEQAAFEGAKAEPKAEPTLRLIVAGAEVAKSAPGVIGEIAEFTVDSAMYPIMKFGTALGIGVVGTLISRRIAGPTGPRGCATHLYQGLIGPTGIGKEHMRTVGKLLLRLARRQR